MWPFAKKQEREGDAVGFEPEEKPTPFLGKVLLLILTVVLLFFGWRGLEDLKRVPQRPEQLSPCFVHMGEGTTPQNMPLYPFQFQYDFSCEFSSYETDAGVPAAFTQARDAYQRDLAGVESRIANLQRQLSILQSQYDTSLRERIAQQDPLRQTPEQIRAQILSLEGQLRSAQAERSQAEAQFRATYLPPLIEAYREARASYDRAVNWYGLQVFVLMLMFTFPFFLFALWFYRKLHGTASPYTVISIPVIIVASILLAWVILLYFWELFLADLLEFFFRAFATFPIFRTLLYYLGMAFAFAVFGGAVFLLQRSVFAPHRVRSRRIRHQQCPYCETPLVLGKLFCPGCGHRLSMKCSSCGQERYADVRFCPWCGKEEGSAA